MSQITWGEGVFALAAVVIACEVLRRRGWTFHNPRAKRAGRVIFTILGGLFLGYIFFLVWPTFSQPTQSSDSLIEMLPLFLMIGIYGVAAWLIHRGRSGGGSARSP